MSYIWEQYKKDQIYKVAGILEDTAVGRDRLSPYMEMAFESAKTNYVNPMLRFSDIFYDVDQLRKSGTLKSDAIENIFFHILINMDKLKGLDYKQIHLNYMEECLERGFWGTHAKAEYSFWNAKDQRILLEALYLHVTECAENSFLWAVGRLYKKYSMIYEADKEVFYLYIGEKKTEYGEKKLGLLIELLWSIGTELEVIWEYHYGLLGTEPTMHIDKITMM